MLTLGFHFLLRPGKYACTSCPESTLFRLADIYFYQCSQWIDHLHCPPRILDTATFVCLKFTNQKNGVQGERIGLGRSGTPSFCPVVACINRVKHLCNFHAAPETPLYAFFHQSWWAISTSILTQELRLTITTVGPLVGLAPEDVSIRSLRSSGAMALLCANVLHPSVGPLVV